MIRRNPITGAPVLLAPERLLRPHALGGDEEIVCPFCPGNEPETPPEIWRDGDPWSIRVFPNKYPAADRHEIVVETAVHDAVFEDLDHAIVLALAHERLIFDVAERAAPRARERRGLGGEARRDERRAEDLRVRVLQRGAASAAMVLENDGGR